MTYLVPFLNVDPDLAAKETRTATLFEAHEGIPAGAYGLIESYCPDAECDCRRVMINVIEKERPARTLASIGYGFDREAEDAGPYLDPLNEQCPCAGALMGLVEGVALNDPDYVARLERHYELVKRAAADPAHPAYETLRQATESDGGWLSVEAMDALLGGRTPGPVPRPAGRNDPCPCGSGKKYKHCCGRRR
jgi:hypothetical protein